MSKKARMRKIKGIHLVDPVDVHEIYGKDLLGQFGETDRQKINRTHITC